MAALLQATAVIAQVDLPETVYSPGFAYDSQTCYLPNGCTFDAPQQVVAGANLTATNPVTNIGHEGTTFPLEVTVTGSLATDVNLPLNVLSLASVGLPAGDYLDEDGGQSFVSVYNFNNGAAVTLTNAADLTMNAGQASGLYKLSWLDAGVWYNSVTGGGALMAASFGAAGYPDGNKNPFQANFDGGDGGAVTVRHDSHVIAVVGSGQTDDPPGSPIPNYLNGIGAFSVGGDGVAIKAHDDDWAGDGGDGGAVDVAVDGTIQMFNASDGQTNAVFAYSLGGVGSNQNNYAIGNGGDGGTVTVEVSGAIMNSAPQGVGVLALSRGGDSDFDNRHGGDDASGAGDGGSTTVTVQNGGSIDMTGNVGIGVM
ncbi:MAG: hypothetical protein EOM91_18660, partial [Sphingobacteriia bacterium]|nr:hypothetical protein [Sphingobacteriia bacterium]